MRAALFLAISACAADDGGPRLDSVMPAAASANAQVVVAGSRLCGPSDDCAHAASTVQLGLSPPMIDVLISTYTATSLTFVVPATTAGKTSVEVTVDGRSSNALAFEVLP